MRKVALMAVLAAATFGFKVYSRVQTGPVAAAPGPVLYPAMCGGAQLS